MARTRIKICGICRPRDAETAARAGADAIGLVFDPNAGRCVSVELAGEIIAALPPFVMPIGLFVNASVETIRQVIMHVPLAAVQLHGDESPELIAALKPVPVIKALRLSSAEAHQIAFWREAIATLRLTNLAGILLETAGGPAPGGTGVANDWNGLHALQLAGNFHALPPLIAAGGLTPQNVGKVVCLLHPFAVDVSSGVESQRREKSPEKIQAFVQAVRQADGN